MGGRGGKERTEDSMAFMLWWVDNVAGFYCK